MEQLRSGPVHTVTYLLRALWCMRPVHTNPDKFETDKMFSVHTNPVVILPWKWIKCTPSTMKRCLRPRNALMHGRTCVYMRTWPLSHQGFQKGPFFAIHINDYNAFSNLSTLESVFKSSISVFQNTVSVWTGLSKLGWLMWSDVMHVIHGYILKRSYF